MHGFGEILQMLGNPTQTFHPRHTETDYILDIISKACVISISFGPNIPVHLRIRFLSALYTHPESYPLPSFVSLRQCDVSFAHSQPSTTGSSCYLPARGGVDVVSSTVAAFESRCLLIEKNREWTTNDKMC